VAPEPEGTSSHSWEPASNPYPEPGEYLHPYKTILKIIAVYILMFRVLERRWQQERF
jgi:hypothetical protein